MARRTSTAYVSDMMEYMAEGESNAASGVSAASNSAIMYELDIATGELQWSDALYSVLHYPRTEPFNRLEWWVEHIHPDDAMRLNNAMDLLQDPKVPWWTVEYRFRTSSGTYVLVRDEASIIRHRSTGLATRIIGTITPIAPAA
jgi:PAS domain-containing protein